MRSTLFLILLILAALDFPASVHAEQPNMPLPALVEHASAILVGECQKAEKKTTRRGDMEDTSWFHHVKVDRVERDRTTGTPVAAGDVVVILSQSRAWVGKGLPPTYGTGHRGMPAQGERCRVYASECAGSARTEHDGVRWLNAMSPNGWQSAARHVVLVGADDEYRSEISMPLIADCLERDVGARTTVAFPANPATRQLDVARRDHIEHLGMLHDADVGVLFMRWRELDASNSSALNDFLRSGQPVVGLRTSTHLVRTPGLAAANPPADSIDVELPTRIFGQRWISHHGAGTRTRILAPEGTAVQHPILRGVRGGVEVPSWLYDVTPLPDDCTVLLWGEVVGGERTPPVKQPIVWVREHMPAAGARQPRLPRRMAFTTLGHPGDFSEPQVRRLVEQMIVWAAGDEELIPAEGLKGEPAVPYRAPPTR